MRWLALVRSQLLILRTNSRVVRESKTKKLVKKQEFVCVRLNSEYDLFGCLSDRSSWLDELQIVTELMKTVECASAVRHEMNKCASVQTRLCNNTRMYCGSRICPNACKTLRSAWIRLKYRDAAEVLMKTNTKTSTTMRKSLIRNVQRKYISVAKIYNNIASELLLFPLSLSHLFAGFINETTQPHNDTTETTNTNMRRKRD